MSAVIKTTTPFAVQEALFEALVALGYEPVLLTERNLANHVYRGQLQIGDIVTNRQDYYGKQHFRLMNDHWVLRHDSSEMDGRLISKTSKKYQNVSMFLKELEVEYAVQYQSHLKKLAELERQRIEEERKARVEATRKRAIEQAKAQGYVVKEKHINGKIQLVCTRSI